MVPGVGSGTGGVSVGISGAADVPNGADASFDAL
jgi:hypothetical protein